MISATIHFASGNSLKTRMNGTIQTVRAYYLIGSKFNIGRGPHDHWETVSRVDIEGEKPVPDGPNVRNGIAMPMIHNNGNSAASLLEELAVSYDKLAELRKAFNDTDYIHRRNFYPLPNEHYEKALAQRKEITDMFSKIEDYINAHMAHIAPFVK